MDMHYKRAHVVKDGGSIIADYTDEDGTTVSYYFRRDYRVFHAEHQGGYITEKSRVTSPVELAALERAITAHLKKYGSAKHESAREKRHEFTSRAFELMEQEKSQEAILLFRKVQQEEESAGDGDYPWAERALEILRGAS